jgi:hypothetical protein
MSASDLFVTKAKINPVGRYQLDPLNRTKYYF